MAPKKNRLSLQPPGQTLPIAKSNTEAYSRRAKFPDRNSAPRVTDPTTAVVEVMRAETRSKNIVTRWLLPVFASLTLGACATNTIAPSYETSNPDIQVGGASPEDRPPHIDSAGSFCLEITEKWHRDGNTPDGQALWARDTLRKVVPCT